jgi:hypothetical protein
MSFDPNTPPPPPPKTSGYGGQPGNPQAGAPLTPYVHPFGQAPTSQEQWEASQQYQPDDRGAPQQPQPPRQALPVPEILKSKPKDDLNYVLHSSALLSALATTSFEDPNSPQEALKHYLDSNVALAQSVQQLEQQLANQRESTQTHLLQLHAMERQWRAKQKDMDGAIEKFTPKALYQQLNMAVGEASQICDALEESFMGGDGKATDKEVAEFLKGYREGKKRWYLRREKKERWDEGRVGGWP